MASFNLTSMDEQADSQDPKVTLLPWMIGTVADNLLQGIITIQLLHYFSYFHAYRSLGSPPRPRDVFVFVLGVLSFAKSGQCIAIIWEHNITYKLDVDEVHDMGLYNYLELLTPFTTALLGYLVQIFFLIWHWKMSRCFWVTCWCGFWLLSSFVLLIVVTLYLIQGRFDLVPFLAIGYSAVVAIADFSLSVALGGHIWRAKSEVPGPILNRLVRAVFISGLPCAIAALIIVICFATLPSYNMICVIFNLLMAKLYVVSCLYTLNCRNELREEWDSEQGAVDLDLDDIRFKVVDWEKAVGHTSTQVKVDNASPLVPLDQEGLDLCPCDPTTLEAEIIRLSSDRFAVAGESVAVELDIVEPYSFERRARRMTIGGSDMVDQHITH